jgi:hypothetical protein
MKYTLAQILLLSSASATNLFNLEDNLIEDLDVKMSEYEGDRLDRNYGRKFHDA